VKKIKNFIFYWLPSIIWMLIIFYFSSRPRFGITHKFLFDFVIFKTLHMIEYGILYFLLFRAFYRTTTLSPSKKILFPLLFAIIYAVTDEFHQLFIPTREGRIRDLMIDSGGIIIVYYYIKHNLNFIKKYLK
jgi:VanZ family protein